MKKEAISAIVGATRYEFRMQIRRKALWIVMLLFSLLVFTGLSNPWQVLGELPLHLVISEWSTVLQIFMPIAFGCLLADRLPRDRRTGAAELLDTCPSSPGGRLLGKYLGATLATMVPILLVYAAGIAYVVAEAGDWSAIPLGLAAFAAINLPGLLFVAAFSVACPAVLWVPLYQFLFVGYWFWGNLLSEGYGIPTLSGTVLTPVGENAAVGLFGVRRGWVTDATAWEGALSIGLMLALSAAALYAAHRYLAWQRSRA